MKNSILLILFAILFSCCNTSHKNQSKVYSTQIGEFLLCIDTLNINLKPYVSSNKVYLTHAIKYMDKYYCYYEDRKERFRKYFFVISNNGSIEKEVELPNDLACCLYLDLFVMHDTIFTKPYMGNKNYYLDTQTLKMVEIPEPDDVIYEDEGFYVTCLDFGEWGSTTWFKDKSSGNEYELASPAGTINKIDSIYYFSTGFGVLKVVNPLKMKQCDKNCYYHKIKNKRISEGSNSLLGANILYYDTTYSPWEDKHKQNILTSFKYDNKLFYLCNDSAGTFIATLKNKNMILIQNIGNIYSPIKSYSSYRCKIQEDGFQLLIFYLNNSHTYGFIEIKENKLNIRYINTQNN